ncbi:MAG: AIR synthase-related protein [Promethearchaeota archaeon]
MAKFSKKELLSILRGVKAHKNVLIGPRPGFDSGVYDLGEGQVMVVSTDPCINVPLKYFGWFTVHFAASDLALFGIEPSALSVNLLGPPGSSPHLFQKIMDQISVAADELNIGIVGGHTGVYEGISTFLATCTVFGIGKREKLITPGGAQPGDHILLTKHLGHEVLCNLAISYPQWLFSHIESEFVTYYQESFRFQSAVADALTLRQFSAHALHDVTEGGLAIALNEVAEASGVGFRLDANRLPLTPCFNAVLEALNLHNKVSNPHLGISSTGMVIAAIPSQEVSAALKALSNQKIPVTDVGIFTEKLARLWHQPSSKQAESFPQEVEDLYTDIFSLIKTKNASHTSF